MDPELTQMGERAEKDVYHNCILMGSELLICRDMESTEQKNRPKWTLRINLQYLRHKIH